jgi:hypothetical protein
MPPTLRELGLMLDDSDEPVLAPVATLTQLTDLAVWWSVDTEIRRSELLALRHLTRLESLYLGMVVYEDDYQLYVGAPRVTNQHLRRPPRPLRALQVIDISIDLPNTRTTIALRAIGRCCHNLRSRILSGRNVLQGLDHPNAQVPLFPHLEPLNIDELGVEVDSSFFTQDPYVPRRSHAGPRIHISVLSDAAEGQWAEGLLNGDELKE